MFTLQRQTIKGQLEQIERIGGELRLRSDAELRAESIELRFRAQSGESFAALIPPAFALVREAADRTLGQRHYEVQLVGGLHMANCRAIEMETGQGKTLTATLPLYLFALEGRGSHLATSNDYLAERDAETMRPLYELLGLSCGYVIDAMEDDHRRENYACDITYGTGTEFGFDFLRDRMKTRSQAVGHPSVTRAIARKTQQGGRQGVQRGLHFILADEADALLIDDANTPMILGAEVSVDPKHAVDYAWAVSMAPRAIEPTHYTFKTRNRTVELTLQGRTWVRQQWSQDRVMRQHSILQVYELIEKAIKVHRDFHRDKQYLVRDEKIVLVNESTGRIGEGREMQDGLHQLIQATEGLEVTEPNSHAARITVQGLFLLYRKMAGMSGTILSAQQEFRRVYKKTVVRIPTAKRSVRRKWTTRVVPSEEHRWSAIVDEATEMQHLGRATLIGTRSVAKSERLSAELTARGIVHTVLNARQHAEEAEIISKAGQSAAITVATGLAGRGTDIKISEAVEAAGGLHVIMSELHDSIRSDQQLVGRCGRQGQPGSYRQFLSIDDEILELSIGESEANRWRARRHRLGAQWVESTLLTLQKNLERRSRALRWAAFSQEKSKLRALREMGLDPVLDSIS